jgi:hypothetical protein
MMKTWVKVLLGMVGLVFIAGVLLYFFVYAKPHPKYEKLEPDYVMEAEALFREFQADETAAQNRYNGKMVQVDGTLDGVEQVDDMVILTFEFEEGFFGMAGIRATMLDNHREDALPLTPGTHVTVKGFCAGFDDSVILEYASLQNQ